MNGESQYFHNKETADDGTGVIYKSGDFIQECVSLLMRILMD